MIGNVEPSGERVRILFVDDDATVLTALSNVLRRERHRWDMVFAIGGNAGLAELGKGAFDVVVSDRRMPEVSGEQLLEIVKRDSPRTVRVMLSGSEPGPVPPAADEMLAKPCSAKVLRETLERITARAR